MNWTDMVDLGADILPRAVLRGVFAFLAIFMVVNGPAASRLVLSYGEAKARPLIDSIINETAAQPGPSNVTSPRPPK